MKISICVQVTGAACYNGNSLIRRSFTQETRKQSFSEINQIYARGACGFFLSHLLKCRRPPRRRLSSFWLTKVTQLQSEIQTGFAELLLCSTSVFPSHPSHLATCFLFQKVAFILIFVCIHPIKLLLSIISC